MQLKETPRVWSQKLEDSSFPVIRHVCFPTEPDFKEVDQTFFCGFVGKHEHSRACRQKVATLPSEKIWHY